MSVPPTPEPGRQVPGQPGAAGGHVPPQQSVPRTRREARGEPAGSRPPAPQISPPGAVPPQVARHQPTPQHQPEAQPALQQSPVQQSPAPQQGLIAANGSPSGWVPPAAAEAAKPLGEPRFTRVSGRLIALNLLSNAIATVITVAVLVVARQLVPFDWAELLLWLAAIPVILFIVQAIVTTRQVRALGYSEREEDLLIATGILFRRLIVIPYGRLQFVEVKSGPLERGMGLSTLHLHTAAAATKAELPGLPRDEAVRLRERLANRAENDLAGL